jgi:DNA mismatch repair protein MutL
MSQTRAASIAVLPELVRNQIAAGEVVERPASVVKELVENALDAGAAHVRLDLEEGGAKLVRVTDDGVGMTPDDLELAFESHATSKLGDAADLEHIATLGFRGEALASIGSVARCLVLSRPRGAALGAQVENEGGRITPVREAGAPDGTRIEVRDLFFNTPARRRFLKTKATELARCLDVLQRIALAHEGVGFEVHHDGKNVATIEPGMDLRDRVRRFFGAELAESLVPVEGADGDTRLVGLVAPPRFARRDTTRQMWFLNGRPLRDKVLVRCLKDAYHGFLVEGRQPVAFLNLSMDPARVDVNVHPQKSEVRFRDSRRVFGFLAGVLREAVASTDMATPGERVLEIAARREGTGALDFAPPLPGPPREYGGSSLAREAPARSHEHAHGHVHAHGHGHAAHDHHSHPAPEPLAAVDDFTGPFLQVAHTYLLRAVPDGFEIVDQHALHERLTYEELRRDYADGTIEVQRLLVPEPIEVGPAGARLLESHAEALSGIGIHVSRFGEGTVAVDGLPARLRGPDAEGVLRDVLAILERTGKAPDAAEVLEEVLHSAACRSSVMAGDRLDDQEIRSLLERAAALESDQTCPHARPTRVRFTTADLEKAFHRR